jgi:hydroxymethylglutaryl-CoA synthase
MAVGIISFGSYIPKNRVYINNSHLNINQRSIAGIDEDTVTISVAAAKKALSKINPAKIGAIYIGSESHPYAVKPTATIVGAAFGVGENFMSANVEFACKGGTAALQICYALVKAQMIDYGLAIGADVAQAAPKDILEQSAAAGGAAFIIGKDDNEIIATIDATSSVSFDTPDFWRRGLQKYPEHMNRFTGEPSYFKTVIASTKKILELTNLKPSDFHYVVFHQPNGKFPLTVAHALGFSMEQLNPGLLVTKIGNTYSASSLLGLTAVLDQAKPTQKILLVSYGSGSGSDAFILTTTQSINSAKTLENQNRRTISTKGVLR